MTMVPMSVIATVAVLLLAALHAYILVLEMFLWTGPRARAAFGTTSEFAEATKALGTFGNSATAALPVLQQLVSCPDWTARTAALVALWHIGDDDQEVLDLLRAHLVGPAVFHDDGVGTVLAGLGPAAAELAPRLRKLLADNYEWKRVHAAEALWLVSGAPETQTVLEVLLQAWTQNQATASFVVTVLDRMGPAAAPALPQLRAEIAKIRRGGRFGTIDADEDLVETCQRLIDYLE